MTAVVSSLRPDLNALGAELQRELRLQDWEVTYGYVRELADADGRPVYGLCDRLVDAKTASIWIRDPVDPLPAGVDSKSVEGILIHELVHLHMAPLSVDTQQGIYAEEQAVWPIASALEKWRGTVRAVMVARAMSLRAKQWVAKTAPRSTRNMNRSELAMLKAAMGDGKDCEASLKAVAAALDAYESAMPADGAEGEEPPESEGEPKPPEAAVAARAEETESAKKPKEARAAAEEEKPKAAMRLSDVRHEAARAARLEYQAQSERAALIAGSKELFGAPELAVLSTLPLPTLKSMVAARRMAATKTPEASARSARVHVGPMVSLQTDDAGLSPDLVKRMDQLMNTNSSPPAALARTATGGVAFSHLATETVSQQIRRMAAGQVAK